MKISASPDLDNDQASINLTPRRHFNWTLLVGLALVIIISILAIIGPDIAPKDPNEEQNITMINGQWYVPPFDFGTPGYPLGSDNFGRDLYSRLLWGIRPTMIMVVVVAVIRLVLGVIIGLSAGWFTGKTGRFLNGLIQLALALPVLLVALGAIAIVGVELGIWAFIIGLSLTGWVDTALQVREQTRIVKGQVYVEAASAIGASNQQILSNHILKQITPMLLMLFAFEISSTLMLTAGLGFLGYYIGGDVWVETDDFVARRISGNPELGQMLATSWVTLTKPWAMVAVGTTIFITVLGFNLIGEGLRENLGFAKVRGRSYFAEKRDQIGLWFDHNLWHPVIQFTRIKPLRLGMSLIAIFFILSFGALVMLDAAAQTDSSGVLFSNNGNATSQAEPASQSMDEDMPTAGSSQEPTQQMVTYAPSINWEFVDEGGFSGGPAFSSNGRQIYLASQSGNVYALDLEGKIIWQTQISFGAVGTPVLDGSGNIFIAEQTGGLLKITPQGDLLWRFQTQAGDKSHAGPMIGPEGTIYYTVGTSSEGYVQAVSPSGEGLWVSKAKTRSFFEPPFPSKDGKYVFLKDDIFSVDNGDFIELDSELDILRFFSGDDGKNYLLSGHKIIQWQQNGTQIELIDVAEWDSSDFSESVAPGDVGVNEDGVSWQLYTSPGGTTVSVWVSPDDQFLGSTRVRISASRLVSMQNDLSAFVCGGGPFNTSTTDCALLNPASSEPIWEFHLGNFGPVAGGVIIDGRYFVTTEDGYAFEIDENRNEITTSTGSATQKPEGTKPIEIGIQWSYNPQITNGAVLGLIKNDEGNIYIFTGDDNLHILKPDGELLNVIQLPGPQFHQLSATGRSAPLDILPEILPDGTILHTSEDSIVYALNPDGNLLWEQKLEADPAVPPIQDGKGNLYLIDANAGLNSFNKNGLNWRFQSDAANIPASGQIIGPEGNIYYVVTNYSQAYIQAVSNDGNELWETQARTRDFYNELHISSDGEFISLAENLIQTNTGEIIEYDPENKIDEYIFSENGQNFLRSLHTIKQWQLGSSGIEILSEGMVSEENTTLRPPLASSADSNGILWLSYPERYTGGGIIIVWMTPEGEILGRHVVERSFQNIVSIDMEKSLLTECIGFEDTQTIECTAYSPKSFEPIWEVVAKDIPSYYAGMLIEDYLYLFGEEIYAVFVGEPTIP